MAQAMKISSQTNPLQTEKPPKPYWFESLLAQGYSEQQINYAIEIQGYDPDAVQNFLLDNVLL